MDRGVDGSRPAVTETPLDDVDVAARRPSLGAGLLWLAPLGFLGVFFFYPLAAILAASLARSPAGPLAPWVDLLSRASFPRVIGFTFGQALASTALTFLLGLPAAYLVGRHTFRGRSLLLALTAVPFVMPTVVVAAAFTALLGPRGWVNVALMQMFHLEAPPIVFVHTLTAILVAHVFYNTTIVVRLVGDFWSHLDPRQTQAAQALGAGRAYAWRTVTLPLLLPAIAAAAVLVFLFDFTSFGVILLLGGPRFSTLEVEIYTETVGLLNLPIAATLALIQLACTLALSGVYTALARRVNRPLTLQPARLAQQPLMGARQRWLAAVVVATLSAFLLAPLAALALRSVTRLDPERGQTSLPAPTVTLAYYQALDENPRQSIFHAAPTTAIGVSLTYAAMTVVLSLVLGMPVAWMLARRPDDFLSRLVDPLLLLPLGTSAVTLGLGFTLALAAPPLDLRTSPILIPLAHTLVAFPFVVRSLLPPLRSLQPRLRQAASVLGAPPWRVFRTIELPLITRALLLASAFSFTISLGEFGATTILARPEFPTLPVAIYRYLSRPGALNYGQALAMSTILMVVCAAAMLALERLRFGEQGEF
jgi:thiamine transport system permease protein